MSDHHQLSRPDLLRWLTATGDAQQELFRQAREVRHDESATRSCCGG